MLKIIKQRIEKEIGRFAASFQRPPLAAIPRPFGEQIEQFLRRDGKRLRSQMFVLGYRGFSSREPRNLYRSGASLELLHDFILIHDDLIDHASLRRGSASMHESLDLLLNGQRGLRFRGQDLALIVGDMLYAMAINGFLSIDEDPVRKQRALEMLTQTALFTGCGELDELLYTLRPLSQVEPRSIYRVYDWKTGHYTFSSPLAMGAILAGAPASDVKALAAIGVALGRAFQIRDDLLDLYGDGNRFGKPAFIDLREGKKTLPVWYAYSVAKPSERRVLERVLEKPGADDVAIRKAAAIIHRSGAAAYSSGEMARLLKEAARKLHRTGMRVPCRDQLIAYATQLLQPPAGIEAAKDA